MPWLLLGIAILALILLGVRVFERAPVAAIRTFLYWVLGFGGVALALLLLVSGRGIPILTAVAVAAPLVRRTWQHRKAAAGFAAGPGQDAKPDAPSRSRQGLSRDEAYAVLGLKPGASEAEIRDAHRRLMRAAHPDTGGSDWLAARINQARDTLLG
jgi:hypothetical protein